MSSLRRQGTVQKEMTKLALLTNHEKAINNYRTFLKFKPKNDSGPECEEFIKLLKRNKTWSACEIIKNFMGSWENWSFTMEIREPEGGAITVNVLHVAIIMQNSKLIDAILNSKVSSEFLHQRVESKMKEKSHEKVEPEIKWIYGASSVHLAARYFASCIPNLLKKYDLINDASNQAGMTPLHVAAIGSYSLATKILLEQDDNVQTKDFLQRSPLFYAAKNRNYEDAMFLVIKGCCDIFEADQDGKKPFQVASCSKIMKFFISRMSVEKLHEKDPQNEMYEEVVENHPELIQSYLDIFISSDRKANTIKFDLSLFTTDTPRNDEQKDSKKESWTFNKMHRHRKLIESGQENHLLHPLMLAFVDIKWRNFMTRFIPMTVFIFIAFAIFTWHSFMYVDITRCSNDDKVSGNCSKGFGHIIICNTDETANKWKTWKNDNPSQSEGYNMIFNDACSKLNCSSKKVWVEIGKESEWQNFNVIFDCLEQGYNQFYASRYMTITAVVLFAILEFQQFLKKSYKEGNFYSYFTIQNTTELVILIATILFLVYSPTHVELAGHLSGWILFLGWANFTFYIGKLSSLGRAFFNSLFLAKETVKTLLIFLPSLFGFTCAFHIFLHGNAQFYDLPRSIIKVFTMFTGEYEFETNFNYDVVKESGGRNFSLQILFLCFVMYGAVIIMNLLVALMTNVLDMNKAQVMIITQRVEELGERLELPILGLFNSCKEGLTSFISSKTTTDPVLINLENFKEEPVENHPTPIVTMEFDVKRPEETNKILRGIGPDRRPLPIRKIMKENEEAVAKAFDVWPYALRIQKSIVTSTIEAINRKKELHKVIASENAQIMEKIDKRKQEMLQLSDDLMETRLSLEQQQLS